MLGASVAAAGLGAFALYEAASAGAVAGGVRRAAVPTVD